MLETKEQRQPETTCEDNDLQTLLDAAVSALTPEELAEYNRDLCETRRMQDHLLVSVNCKTCVVPVGKCKELWDRVYLQLTNTSPDSLKYADFALKEYLFDRERLNIIPEFLRVAITLAEGIPPNFAFTSPRVTVTQFPNSKNVYVSIQTTTFRTLMLDLFQIERELSGQILCISGVNPSPGLRQMS